MYALKYNMCVCVIACWPKALKTEIKYIKHLNSTFEGLVKSIQLTTKWEYLIISLRLDG